MRLPERRRVGVGLFAVICMALMGAGEVAGAQGFESAKTLPAGVRNLTIRTVESDIAETTDGSGKRRSLAEPLAQDLTFAKIAAGEPTLKAKQMRAFLAAHQFSEDQVVGSFSADLKGRVEVTAPIFAYGIAENLTIGFAVPFYKAATAVEVGFAANKTAQSFLDTLARPENNQSEAAREAGLKLNSAVAELNAKLVANNYRELTDWRAQGLGDTTLLAKYRFFESSSVGMALANGVVLPTGRTDDPDILTDIAFGDGQSDIFSQFVIDEEVGLGLRFNQHVKYTHQLPSDKIVRQVEADEVIEVGKERARFKLGDKIDAGAAVLFEPEFGLVAGLGYSYFRKFGDVYRELASRSKQILESGTDQEAGTALYQIGYSTVPHYQAGQAKVPFELKMTWSTQLSSRNMPVSDLAQFDINLFF